MEQRWAKRILARPTKDAHKSGGPGKDAIGPELVRLPIMIRHHNRSSLAKKGLICLTLPHHHSSAKAVRTGTQTGQKPEGRS